MIIQIYSETPHKRYVSLAAKSLRAGRLIVLPTDTLYGLACEISNKKAVEQVYQIKGLSSKKPLSFLCSDLSQVSKFANLSTQAYRIIRHCAPGAYTFVLPARQIVPKILRTKQKTVGIRIPDSLFAREIVKELKAPIISTTLTTNSDIPHSNPQEIQKEYGHLVEYVFDAGETFSDPSTIIDLTGDEISVIREGKGSIEEI